MAGKILATADWHLTVNPNDEYRWEFLRWFTKTLLPEEKPDALVVLGDLTHAKDCHSAQLVNRMVFALVQMAKLQPVYVLKGNHDYRFEHTPFFEFISRIPNLTCISRPMNATLCGRNCTFMPHMPPSAFNDAFTDVCKRDADWTTILFMHQTFNGAVAANGTPLASKLDGTDGMRCMKLSGDVHVPQKINDVVYVGAPYPVHFGDTYTPRVIAVEGKKRRTIRVPHIKKVVVTVTSAKMLDGFGLSTGDQVRVRVQCGGGFSAWQKERYAVSSWCSDHGVRLDSVEVVGNDTKVIKRSKVVCSSDPATVFKAFCKASGAKYISEGQALLERAKA